LQIPAAVTAQFEIQLLVQRESAKTVRARSATTLLPDINSQCSSCHCCKGAQPCYSGKHVLLEADTQLSHLQHEQREAEGLYNCPSRRQRI